MALVAALGVVSACGGGTNDSPSATQQTGASSAAAGDSGPQFVDFRTVEPGSGAGLKLGYISLSEAVPFIKLVSDSIKKQAEAAGAELVFCDSQGDAAKALECARNFKTQGVQGYLNFQQDAKAAAAICQAGPQVPVVAIDIQQDPCQKAFMGANNDRAGFIAGEAVGNHAKSQWDCQYDGFVSLEQPEAGAVNEARMGGYRKGFESVCGPGSVKNLKKVNAFRVDMARTAVADVLTSLPGAKKIIVVGINDDSILGALAAARTVGRQGDVFVAAQGADPSSWCEIKSNPNWIADTAYFPERYGEIGIPYLIDLVKNKSVPANLLVNHQAVTKDNVEQLYQPSC
ncbi:sugar ABC transporter substrate-binding protein [Asanoa siamensis]|uniref:Sugar ABC transporter substrate-binding protein n=1 Tax=Asanoa siamensis TaxID=926357 RepID=A0ABQ4CT41_9ACTN|nr:sugar ABC transporter substrate-binding protein [Asanoa siamensis]GIF74436.1 sugar ABC transporter substrate-binding protein [Asanoa siamensis]